MPAENSISIIGTSKAIQRVRTEVKRLSKTLKNVIIVGEPGVGKNLIAESIHRLSKNAKKPIARINLSAIDQGKMREFVKSIVEQRLFRNPSVSSHGDFRLPKGSTLVLDGVEKSASTVQTALCQLLEISDARSLGYRYIFTLPDELAQLKTHHSIADCLSTHLKHFQKLNIPPLRERPQDIIDLVEYFLKEFGDNLQIKDLVIDPNTLEILVRQEWKGNVRELRECVAQSIILSDGKQEFHLPEKFISEQTELQKILLKIEEGVEFAIDSSMGIIEKRILERVLSKFNNNQSRAARFLRITEDTLRYRMKRLGVRTSQKKL